MSIAIALQERLTGLLVTGITALCVIFCLSNPVYAGPREQAKRIHDRIAGVPPTNAILDSMQQDVEANDVAAAVATAMQNKNFYNVTIKNMVTPWTNEDRTVFRPLNDYTALVIGTIRDDYDFREILFANRLYVAGPAVTATAYSLSDNDHYVDLENSFQDMGDPQVLEETTQTAVYGPLGLNLDGGYATAGIMTTRAAARAFFYAGTNRAMFRFTMLNHLCYDMEAIKDITRPSDKIHQDVTRSPGGDSSIFLNACNGCHAGMDAMMGAYAYYDWQYDRDNDPEGTNGQLTYNMTDQPLLINTDDPAEATPSRVVQKFVQNYNNFIYGHITRDDSWVNYWRRGPNNNILQWSNTLPVGVTQPPESGGYTFGAGAKQLGEEMANTRAFAECQVKKVFRTVCHAEPTNQQILEMANSFDNDYLLKNVFVDAMSRCLGP